MKQENNLLLAFLLSMLILIGYDYLFLPQSAESPPEQGSEVASPQASPQSSPPSQYGGDEPSITMPSIASSTAASAAPNFGDEPRLAFANGTVRGSINLRGGKLDDLVLEKYQQGLNDTSAPIRLLTPGGYFVRHGWVSGDRSIKLPSADALWRGKRLGDREFVLEWDNGDGLTFSRHFRLDDEYMFTVSQRVENSSNAPVSLATYGLMMRQPTPPVSGFFILHEGAIGYLGDELVEQDYDEIEDSKYAVDNGWLGITDKYWLVALIPESGGFNGRILKSGGERYQVDYLGKTVTVAPGGIAEFRSMVFAGAKVLELLDAYQEQYQIPRFELAVDFGWFYFLTKPIFYLLSFFSAILGNFGLAILALTVIMRLLLYPLANKSFTTMHKMKALQPQLAALQKRHKDDKSKLRLEMMELYKKHKLNPAAGCLPILLQIPVFFSLYKVLFISIEMRHAPFYGWVRDLSAPDPTSIFNLFGLLPFSPPTFLQLGIWPILMGLSIFLQQRLSPKPADKMQAKVMSFLPWLFMVLLATFPAGLLIYWTWNNVLSILQQYLLNRRLEGEGK